MTQTHVPTASMRSTRALADCCRSLRVVFSVFAVASHAAAASLRIAYKVCISPRHWERLVVFGMRAVQPVGRHRGAALLDYRRSAGADDITNTLRAANLDRGLVQDNQVTDAGGRSLPVIPTRP